MGVDSVGVDFVGMNSEYECFHPLFSSIYKPEPCSCLLQCADINHSYMRRLFLVCRLIR